MAILSILGIFNYDNTIFDKLELPANVDKETLITSLCGELAELEILYPNPDVLRMLIGSWSKKEIYNWTKIDEVLRVEYDPIANYDRHETWEEEHEDAIADTTKSEGQTVGRTAGFNSDELVENSGGTATTKNEASRIDGGTLKHTGHIRGNIGVTTSQQMIESELQLRKFNIYDYIIEQFKQRFCLLVY